MNAKIEVVKNTLPYIQPYCILLTISETKDVYVLGDYKSKSKAEEAREYFHKIYVGYGLKYLAKHVKRTLRASNKPIDQLEERIKNPIGDNHEDIQKNTTRRIILD